MCTVGSGFIWKHSQYFYNYFQPSDCKWCSLLLDARTVLGQTRNPFDSLFVWLVVISSMNLANLFWTHMHCLHLLCPVVMSSNCTLCEQESFFFWNKLLKFHLPFSSGNAWGSELCYSPVNIFMLWNIGIFCFPFPPSFFLNVPP